MHRINFSKKLDAIAHAAHNARRLPIQVHACSRLEGGLWDDSGEPPTYHIIASEGDRVFEMYVTDEYGALVYEQPELFGAPSLTGWTQEDELHIHIEQAIADHRYYEEGDE